MPVNLQLENDWQKVEYLGYLVQFYTEIVVERPPKWAVANLRPANYMHIHLAQATPPMTSPPVCRH